MKKEGNVKVSNLVLIIALLFIMVLIYRTGQIALSKKIDNIDIQELASKRTTKTTILKANRGTIFDSNKNILAQDVSSYTVIAYLDSNRTTDDDNPQHVVDKEGTALVLSKLLDIKYETVLEYLKKEGVYQTEFGAKGRGLTELEKDTIKAANLPGIDFMETTKRYYPYGRFLSYLIGYAKANDNGEMTGELGIEKYYNKDLTGIDGKTEYQKDLRGYKIAGTAEVTTDKKDGSNLYLTIDNNVQFFVEEAIANSLKKDYAEEIDIIVANAKTGEILAYATNPSFDPNIRDIKNYLDSNSGVAFEPGSTMKIFTYMAALEAGAYKGTDIYKSGSFIAKDKTIISDWNKVGWGWISYDQGFIYSSNTGVVNMMNKYMKPNQLKDYLKKLGFGSKTGISLANEVNGKIDFKYETEVFNAAFGQGITVTPIQIVKALTSVANDGELLEPYIVKKIDNNGNVIDNQRKSLGRVASSETVEYVKNLMYHTITDNDGAGHIYHLDGYNLIGKTGTAQIAKTNGRGYLTGPTDVNRSIALIFPKDDPEIILYGVAKKPNNAYQLSEITKEIVKNVSKYYNIYKKNDNKNNTNTEIDYYLNNKVKDTIDYLNSKNVKSIVIGNGDTIIDQYPKNIEVTKSDKVFLITNSNELKLPDLSGYSKSDIDIIFSYLNIDYKAIGSGYVTKQSIPKDTIIKDDMIVELTFSNKLIKSE